MSHRTMIWVGVIGLALAVIFVVVILPAMQRVHSSPPTAWSEDHLHNLAIAVWDYESNVGYVPPAASTSSGPPPVDLHNWQTHLLPYVEQKPLHWQFDLHQPWTDPANEPHFHAELDIYLNPSIHVRFDSAGLGLTHYSANSHIVAAGVPLTMSDVTDGDSNTLLTGEIATGLPPWGQPRNVRDPAIGLQTAPTSFGGPWGDRSTQFSFLDGKVQRINANIDPAVLRALATPAGGETVTFP